MSYLYCFMFRRKWEVGAFVSRLRINTRKRSKKRNATELCQAKYIWTKGGPFFLREWRTNGKTDNETIPYFLWKSQTGKKYNSTGQ